jgi:hypothetical protein
MNRVPLFAALFLSLGAIAGDARAQAPGARKPPPSLSAEDVAASKDPVPMNLGGAITDFYYTSDKGDPVGQGSTLTLRQNEMSVTVTPDSRYKNGPVNHVKLVVSGKGGKLFELWFSTEKMEKDLVPGTYEGAGRVEFTKYMQPGIAISGNGRGCLDARGNFSILQAGFHLDSGRLIADSFAVEFEQHCGDRQASLRGHLFYNYAPPAVVH